MNQFKYQLDPSSNKFDCPRCNHQCFVRYEDFLSGTYLPKAYGRCDRENHCQYHLNPYHDGYNKAECLQRKKAYAPSLLQGQSTNQHSYSEPVYIPTEVLERTANNFHLSGFLETLQVGFGFNKQAVYQVAELYKLGAIASGRWQGALTLPFIDASGLIRAIQVKQFDKHLHTTKTGEQRQAATFIHKLSHENWTKAYDQQQKKVTCLFGEHLLNQYPINPIVLVEAPKTAIVLTLCYGVPSDSNTPIFLATYSKQMFKQKRCGVLAGRKVIVYPDTDAFAEWQQQAEAIQKAMPSTDITVSNELQKQISDEQQSKGMDVADILLCEAFIRHCCDGLNADPQEIIQHLLNDDDLNSIRVGDISYETLRSAVKSWIGDGKPSRLNHS